ncbi:MAG: sulfate adenylyltransferase, partial [Luminiphilus sp.]
MALIAPHGADELRPLIVDDARRGELEAEALTLPSLMMSSAAAANAVMMGAGYFTPLTGYMNRADALSVAENMRTSDGLFWPVPVVNLAESCPVEPGQRLALTDPNREGHPLLAVMTVDAVETLSDEDVATILEKVFRTDDPEHPGVAAFTAQGRTVISGPIEVLNYSYFEEDFPDTFRTAMAIR